MADKKYYGLTTSTGDPMPVSPSGSNPAALKTSGSSSGSSSGSRTSSVEVPDWAKGSQYDTAPNEANNYNKPLAPEPPKEPAQPPSNVNDPYGVSSAYSAYLRSTTEESEAVKKARKQLEDLDASTQLGLVNTENKPIPMQFITGQTRAIEDRANALSAPLKYRLADAQAEAQRQQQAAQLAYQEAWQQQSRQDELDKAKNAYGAGIIGEYQFAVQQGYKGTFDQYQNEDANRKRSIAGAGVGSTGLSTAVLTRVQSIANQFDNEQIAKNYNTAMEGYQFAKSIDTNSKNPADDIGMIYAFAKVMDPNSVVREGEYATVQRYAQSWAQAFGFNAQRIFSNTNFLSADAKAKMQSTLQAKVAPLTQAYNNLYKEYGRRIDLITGQPGTGTQFVTNYGQTWAPEQNMGGGTISDADIVESVNAHKGEYQTREALIQALVQAGAAQDRASAIVYQLIPDQEANAITAQQQGGGDTRNWFQQTSPFGRFF